MRFAIFFTFAFLIVGASHYYIWARLIRDPALPTGARLGLTAVLGLLAIGMPASFFLLRTLSLATARVVLFPLYVWMGLMLLLLVLLACGDLVRLGLYISSRLSGSDPADPARRLLVSRIIALGTIVIAAGATTVAIRNALGAVVVRRVRVVLPKLPPALHGTTIVQLTDVHLGPTLGRRWLEGVVASVNDLHPDIVAVTGDLVDGSVAMLRQEVEPIAALRARRGVFFVTGNHEYYFRAAEWLPELQRLGLRVLRNERVRIGQGEASFDLAGVDDLSSRGMLAGHGPDLPGALAGRDPARALVLLAHQPKAVLEASRLGVDLQLSGHTHGGQFWPWRFFVHLQQPYVAGLARHGATWIYVSDGTGFWGPPMRLGTRCEITEVTLLSRETR